MYISPVNNLTREHAFERKKKVTLQTNSLFFLQYMKLIFINGFFLSNSERFFFHTPHRSITFPSDSLFFKIANY